MKKNIFLIINIISMILSMLLSFKYDCINYFFTQHLVSIIYLVLFLKNRNYKYQRKYTIPCIFCSIIFIFMLSLFTKDTLYNSIIINNYSVIFAIIYYLVLILSLFISLMFILNFIFSIDLKHEKTDDMRKKIELIFLIMGIIFISTTTTGFADADFQEAWANVAEDLTDWQTLPFCYLIKICKYIFKTSFVMVIIQFILFMYFIDYSLKVLERETKNKTILISYFILFVIMFPLFDQLRCLMKDVYFAFGISILTVTLIDIYLQNKIDKKQIINIFLSLPLCLFRKGTFILVIIIFIIFIIYFIYKNKKYYAKLFLIFILSLVAILELNYFVAFNFFNYYAPNNKGIYTIPIFQIASFVNDDYEFDIHDKEYLEKYLPFNYIKEVYDPNTVDFVSRDYYVPEELIYKMYNFDYSKIIPINGKLFIQQPKKYASYIFRLMNYLWKIPSSDYEGADYFEDGSYQFSYYQNGEEVIYKSEFTFINDLIEPIKEVFFYKSYLGDYKKKASFPIYMIFVSTVLLIIKRNKHCILYLLPIYFSYFVLYLCMPCSSTRYCLPFIEIWPFLFLISLGMSRKRKI